MSQPVCKNSKFTHRVQSAAMQASSIFFCCVSFKQNPWWMFTYQNCHSLKDTRALSYPRTVVSVHCFEGQHTSQRTKMSWHDNIHSGKHWLESELVFNCWEVVWGRRRGAYGGWLSCTDIWLTLWKTKFTHRRHDFTAPRFTWCCQQILQKDSAQK